VSLALLGFVHSLAAAAVVVAIFFAGYFVAYEPYRALYPDLVDNEIAGRAQSTQAIFRGPMMPIGAHGAVTGLYSLSRGLGISLGPLLGGVAIQAGGENYRWVWLVCSAAIVVSLLVMRALGDEA
jgi:divalent metal cation (Fe/Co/Zn/Cd) transporter